MKDSWPCHAMADTTDTSNRKRFIRVNYDGAEDLVLCGMVAFEKSIRKPHIWYGVEVSFVSPLGQVAKRVFEPDWKEIEKP